MNLGSARRWSNVRSFYDEGIWSDTLQARSPAVRAGVRIVQLVIAAALAFQDRLLNLHAMGLVYTTLLSLGA